MTNNALDYLLWITNSHKNIIGAEFTDQCLSIIQKLKSRNYTADELYSLVTDDELLYNYTDNAAETECEAFSQAFISVLMCMICAKYHSEGQKYMPEDIESIKAEKLDGFFEYLNNTRPKANDCYEYFCKYVCM